MRAPIVLLLTLLALVTAQACSDSASDQEASRTAVVAALDTLAADLAADRPADAAVYTERLQAYLEAYPAFFGSAAALLDRSGRHHQPLPLSHGRRLRRQRPRCALLQHRGAGLGHGTARRERGRLDSPYFDAGGGEIWMITRSVPVRDADGVFAIVTTDLPVDAPAP